MTVFGHRSCRLEFPISNLWFPEFSLRRGLAPPDVKNASRPVGAGLAPPNVRTRVALPNGGRSKQRPYDLFVADWRVSRVRRLRLTDRIFLVNVNLRPRVRVFGDSEYWLLLDVLEAARQRLGFLLCGYVLMPDHGHALIWPPAPLLIPQVLHDVKKVSVLRLHAARGSKGPLWQHQFWDRFVRDAKEFHARLE